MHRSANMRLAITLAAAAACGTASAVEVRLVERVRGVDTEVRCETTTQQCAGRGPASTMRAPDVIGERFTGWSFTSFVTTPCQGTTPPGQPIATRDALGTLANPVYFTILENICAQAAYTPSFTDTDADGLPDWFELTHFPGLAQANGTEDVEPPIGGVAALDGLPLAVEHNLGLHPRIRETRDAGGVSFGYSRVTPLLFDTNIVFYTESSVPAGFHDVRQPYPLGATVTTARSATSQTHEFTVWSVDGAEQRDALGRAEDPARAVIDGPTEAVAYYDPSQQDADADALPDWFERRFLGSLVLSENDDADGDGVPLSSELRLGLMPHVRESADRGGRSIGYTPVVRITFDASYQYTLRSSPVGLIPTTTATLPRGTPVTTPLADAISDQRFGVWMRNGVPVRDALGQAVNPVAFAILSDADLLGLFYTVNADTDADGLPDWFETRIGETDTAPTGDPDGDGASASKEFALGLNTRVAESTAAGGISVGYGRATPLDFRAFPRIRETLVAGLPDAFFASTPTAAALPDATFRLDANSAPALGDWDGDGDRELFVAGTVGGARVVRVFRNGGSAVVLDLERETALETALAPSLAGNAMPALSLGDVDSDGRADLAVGGSTGTVSVFRSTGSFTAAPALLASVATGDASAVPGFADTTGDGRPELVVFRPDGSARAYTHSGNNNAPYAAGAFTANALPATIANATSVSSTDVTEDGVADLVVSDAAGSLWELHRGAGASYALASRVFAGSFPGYANRLAAAAGDLDGDGDGDVIAGFAEGGLVYLRNQVAKLTIDPTVKTLVAGQGIALGLRDPGPPQGPVAPVTWRFVANRSGGTLDPATGAYVSGNQSRRVDIIEAEDARGTTGRTYVNVIDTADQTQVGKAIIVAGGLGTRDAIWGATRTSANRMYRALLHRGYRKEDIRYLSLAYGEALEDAQRYAANDLDGNGIANDELYGLPLRATLQQSLTQWAAGAADLLVVMVDHGTGELFTLNGPEKLSATELDAWLDAQQAGGSDVTLVLDYCFSGSFLGPLKSAPAPRIVLASSTATQPSYLFDGGEVAFSQSVARGVFQGFDVEKAFLQAREQMAEHQAAQLDDDATGAYVEGVDGALARTKVIGPTYAVGQDIPVIESVVASTPSPDGTSTIATQGAESSSGVVSVHPLARIWCTVEAPAPPGTAPLADLPEIPLTFERSTGTYSAAVSGFTDVGTYGVSCYAKDIHGSVSFPAATTVARPQPHEARIVIVVAGETTDPEWMQARAIGNATYHTALARGYAPSQMYWLTRGAAPPVNGCTADCTPTQANLATALGSWLATPSGPGLGSANEVTVFLVGSGGSGVLSPGAGETLDAAQLDAALDAFQDGAAPGTVRPVNVVLDHGEDACSGIGRAFNSTSPATCGPASLIATLAPQGNETRRDRAVFVSSGANQPNARLSGGTVAFLQLLLSHALENRSLGDAFSESRQTLDLLTRTATSVQQPYVDVVTPASAGPVGVPNENADLLALRARFLGGLARSQAPRTTGMASVQGPVGLPVRLYVKADAGDSARTIEAIVTPPGGVPAARLKQALALSSTVTLTYDAQTRRYEGSYTPTTSGEHSVLIVERDGNVLSVPDEATLAIGGTANQVALASASATLAEGAQLTLTATLAQPRAVKTVVPFTLSGDAQLQVDYDVGALAFVFAPGATTASVVLTAAADATSEAGETVVLALGEAEGVVAGQGGASGAAEVRVTITQGAPPDVLFRDSFE